MGDREIILIKKALNEKIETEIYDKKFKSRIEVFILFGAALASSVIVGEIIISNPNILNIFNTFDKIQIFIMIVGLTIFFEGLYFWSIPDLIKVPNLVFFKKVWPYFFIFCTITTFHEWSSNKTFFNWVIVTMVLLLFFFSLYFEICKIIKSLSKILKNKVHDGKDRLAIVLTVIGTVISAIALLK